MSVATLERPVDLRRFAGQFPTGVAVITTCDADGKGHGITMSALTSLSLEPPLFLICLNKTSKTLAAIKTSGHLCINFLAAEQTDVAKVFSSKNDDKFRHVAHTLCGTGSPMIEGAVAHGECTVESSLEGGDHTIIIARVERTHVHQADPLVYHAGKFTALAQDA